MRDSLVSIITPSFNSSQFINECINSVIIQTYNNWEMIIVDDCSQDDSVNIISDMAVKDKRLNLITCDQNIGPSEARNIALKHAKGRYIAFLDSDDIWHKEKLQRQLNFMKEKDCAFSFTSYQPISENGQRYHKIISVPKTLNYHQYLGNTIIGCLTVIIDKKKTGDFLMPFIRSSHDMALWLQILKKGFTAYGLNENLAYYRLVSTSNTSKKWRAAKDVWRVYTILEKLPFYYSVYKFICYSFNAIKKRL